MRILTAGYGGWHPEEFARFLVAHRVETVVDVRLRPDRASMGSFGRARTPERGIERLLTTHGVAYRSLIELGNVFVECDDLRTRYRELLARSGDLLVARLDGIAEPCLLCAERDVADCHRAFIGDFLRARGHVVEHLAP
jgi:uncharacterized protein (DUF488 family)